MKENELTRGEGWRTAIFVALLGVFLIGFILLINLHTVHEQRDSPFAHVCPKGYPANINSNELLLQNQVLGKMQIQCESICGAPISKVWVKCEGTGNSMVCKRV